MASSATKSDELDGRDGLALGGYFPVRLTKTEVGHFYFEGDYLGRPAAVLLDTGASSTVIHKTSADRWNVSYQQSQDTGGGAGAAEIEIFESGNAILVVGKMDILIDNLVVMDLSHVHQALAAQGEQGPDIVLGSDILTAYNALIDYGSSTMYLKMNN